MSFAQQVYSDFSGGFNDSVAAISIKDTEVVTSENADYSVEVKAFRTRKGCTKVNTERLHDREKVITSVTHEEVNRITVTLSPTSLLNGQSFAFVFNGTDWTHNGAVIDITLYGLTVTGTPIEGDAIIIDAERSAVVSTSITGYTFSEETALKKIANLGTYVFTYITLFEYSQSQTLIEYTFTYDKEEFLAKESRKGTYQFIYNQTEDAWYLKGNVVDIEEYGFEEFHLPGADPKPDGFYLQVVVGDTAWRLSNTIVAIDTYGMELTNPSVENDTFTITVSATYTLSHRETNRLSVTIDSEIWGPQLTTLADVTYTYDGSVWNSSGIPFTGSGITVSGTPLSGDKFIVKTVDSSEPVAITDAYTWSIGSKYKKIFVVKGRVYDFDEETQTLVEKIQLTSGAKKIYPFSVFNKFYFGDGSELYVWGAYDHSNAESTATSMNVAVDDIIRNDVSTAGTSTQTTTVSGGTVTVTYATIVTKFKTSGTYVFTFNKKSNWTFEGRIVTLSDYGIVLTGTPAFGDTITVTLTMSDAGHFYKALVAQTAINLTTENFRDTSKWTDVTEVANFASNVVRVLKPTDPSTKETINISVLSGNANAGDINIHFGGADHTISLTAGLSVSGIVNVIAGTTFTGWTAVKGSDGYSVIITKNTVGISDNGYVDPGTTGATFTYTTEVEGKIDDNDLGPIRKCTMFLTHTSSYRVFACGNPDDNAVFYSEVGDPAYFVSGINKVYALSSYGKPTSIMQLSETVLISFENGWYSWSGITAMEDATWKPLNLPYGSVCNDSCTLTPYSYMYLGNDGIYNISASILSTELVLLQGEEVIGKITRNKVDNVINSIYDKSKCEAVFWENTYYLAYNVNDAVDYDGYSAYEIGDIVTYDRTMYQCKVSIPGSSVLRPFDATKWDLYTPPNTRVLKYEWDTGSFTEVTGWKVYNWITDNERLYFASDNYVLEANNGESDIDVNTGNKKAIELKIKTKEYHFGNPLVDKVVRLVGLIFKQPRTLIQSEGADVYDEHGHWVTNKHNTDINAKARIIMGYDTYEIDNINTTESLIWGRDWGHFWGFREAIIKMIELSKNSNTFQIEITNSSIDQPITLLAIGFVYETADFATPTMYKDEELLR